MSNQVSVKTNFTSGQVSPQLFGRGDLHIYSNGASKLHNVVIYPTGGVSRRFGMRHIADVAADSRLVSFEFNTEQTYLLCFEPHKLKIFKNDVCISELDSPWGTEHLAKINWTQSADTLLVVHPDVPPKQICRYEGEDWRIEDWLWAIKNTIAYCPYANFYQKKVGLASLLNWPHANQRLRATKPIFDSRFTNMRIRIQGGYADIVQVVNSTDIEVIYRTAPSTQDTDYNWVEPAFSIVRGYPCSVAFHQDRMVIGGSKSLPNHLWLSKSSDLFNFDIGTGKDDDAIDFSILSDQVNAIVNIISSRHLLVFTTGAEWMVSGDPLTPASIQLRRQTNVGSYINNSLLPQNVDGATLFISQNGRQLREFLYADVEQAYQAKDLTLLSNDVIASPVEITYHQDESILYVVLKDGTVSCLTSYRTEEVNAWSKLKTDGKFKSVAVIGNNVYFTIERGSVTTMEKMDEHFFVDCGKMLISEEPHKIWTGLEYLEGREVSVVADGFTVGKFTVNNGTLSLHEEAREIIVGLPYEHLIEPLPFMVDAALPYFPKAFRLIYGIFRLLETQAMCIDVGNGFCDIPLRKADDDIYYDSPTQKYTGDIEMRALGWIRKMRAPIWVVKSDKPCSFTLLGAVVEVKVKQ